jgi:hypothetical protein
VRLMELNPGQAVASEPLAVQAANLAGMGNDKIQHTDSFKKSIIGE